MIWLYRGVWTGGKFNNTRFWKKLLSFSILFFQLLNILGTKQAKPVRWVCLKCIHEYDFLIEFILANGQIYKGSGIWYFLEQNVYFSLSKTHSWGWFWIGVSFYWQALFTGDRGSIMREAGTRPWIYLAKYSPSVRKHRHSGQILLYSCHSRLPLAAYFAIKRNTNIMLILMLMWMLYVSN